MIFKRAWRSPTVVTWVSIGVRSSSLVLVLPLVLRRFPEADVAVWFVFSAVLAVQGMLSFGFSPSFARLFSYARAGAEVESMADLRGAQGIGTGSGTNWESVGRLYSCMTGVFLRLAGVSALFLAVGGTWAVWRPIAQTGHCWDVWLAWAIVASGASVAFCALIYTTYLQGMDHLLALRRTETVLALGGVLTSFVVLAAGGQLLALVISNQVWTIAAVPVFHQLCRRLNPAEFPRLSGRAWDATVFKVVWPSAWKNGITSLLTLGLIQSTGILQAQFADARATSTYNLMLRIATVLGQVAQTPFLTKVPEMARRRAAGDVRGQVVLIEQAMRRVHWSIVVLTAAVGIALPVGVAALQLPSIEVAPVLWALFALNMFFERHGGMLHQVRNLTNQPLEQWGMLGYFVINVLLICLLYRTAGMYAFPLSMLGAQLLYAVWMPMRAACRAIGVDVVRFELSVSAAPLVCMLISQAIAIGLAELRWK